MNKTNEVELQAYLSYLEAGGIPQPDMIGKLTKEQKPKNPFIQQVGIQSTGTGKIKTATMFTGGGVAPHSAMEEGLLDLIFGVEYDPEIAELYYANYKDGRERLFVGRVQDVGVAQLPDIAAGELDLLQASPQCTNASNANPNATENDEDVSQAQAVVFALTHLRPKYFCLENVAGYRAFEAFQLICSQLTALGYSYHHRLINMADYGVPSTRRRLILLAWRNELPKWHFPEPTHARVPNLFAERWVSWYTAIEDLLPDLPESKFAPWQLERLPPELVNILVDSQNASKADISRPASEPAFTVCGSYARSSGNLPKAWLSADVDGRVRRDDEPAMTLLAKATGGNHPKALLLPVNGENSVCFDDETPAPSITSSHSPSKYKAWLFDCQNMQKEKQYREADQPAFTVAAAMSDRTSHIFRAFIADEKLNDYGRSVTVRDGHSPAMTITSSMDVRRPKAYDGRNRVVKLTGRALARLQSLLDSYILTGINRLDGRVIGNGIPPEFILKLVRSLPL